MPMLTDNEKLTLGMSAAALIVSLASPIYTAVRDHRNDVEQLQISVNRRYDTYGSQVFRTNKSVTQVSIEWELLLVNNGATPVSVIDYGITIVTAETFSFHTRMDLGTFRADGTPVRLPVTIPPGHAESLIVRTGYFLPSSVRQVVTSVVGDATDIDFDELQKGLARRGIDIFGNPAVIQEFENYYSIQRSSPELRSPPTYLISARTARGNRVATTFSFY